MMPLKPKDDPTGFLSLFRFAASQKFGDPSGNIQGRGRWHHGRKAGPGRRHDVSEGGKGRKLRQDPVTRNPFDNSPVIRRYLDAAKTLPLVESLPVRMKLPRLRRCV
jgi:hypothetical protein